MKQPLLIFIAGLACMASFAGELRTWTLNDGKTMEAEFVSVIGDKVALKGKRGELIKIPKVKISEDDMVYIDLCQPPKLDFSFTRQTRQFTYAPLTEWFENDQPPPESLYNTFSTQIKQTSANPYDQELTAEVFVMAVEVDGDQNILIDYRKKTFNLNNENKRTVVIPGAEDLMLTNYIAPSGIRRGEKFAGYMVVVTDLRGEIIAYQTTREWWFEKLDNIRKLPVGKTFDQEGNRCWPTRPKELDY